MIRSPTEAIVRPQFRHMATPSRGDVNSQSFIESEC